MRSRLLVPAMLLSLAACHVQAGYGWGASTSYGSSGIVYNAPVEPVGTTTATTNAAPAPAPATGQGPLGAEVQGSDGTFGWRATGDEASFTRANEALAAGCRVEATQPTETIASCGETKVLVRRDPSHLYRLCASGVDRTQCLTTWTQLGGR